jgi:DNA invertase Pin-like site-specific DNA recombinase
MSEDRKPIAYGYVRESTDRQINGIEVQKDRILTYYSDKWASKLLWGDFFIDKVSAAKYQFLERKAGAALNKRLENGDHVIVMKLDRGFRRLEDFLVMRSSWAKRDIKVHMLDMPFFEGDIPDYIQTLIENVLACIAEFERGRIAERIREAKRWASAQGYAVNGHAGYGFLWRRRNPGKPKIRIRNEIERQQMAYIAQQHLAGFSWAEIHKHFRDHNLLTTKGEEWSIMRIRRACSAEFLLRAQELTGTSMPSPSTASSRASN